jgi:hypothetical protein
MWLQILKDQTVDDHTPLGTDADEKLEQPWTPSPYLRARLLTGVRAALLAGALLVASDVISLLQGKPQGFTPAHALSWSALLPMILVLQTYQELGQEVGSTGLRKSSLGLFWTFGLLQLLGLTDVGIQRSWQIAILVAVALGLLGLLGFLAGQAPNASSKTAAYGYVGALAVGLLLVLKVLAKGGLLSKFLLVKFFAKFFAKWVPKANLESVESIAALMLLISAVFFLIWLGISKIRLRPKLGTAATVIGCAEILLPLVVGIVVAVPMVPLLEAMERPGLNQGEHEALESQIRSNVIASVVVAELAYVGLFVFFFRSMRSHPSPDREATV